MEEKGWGGRKEKKRGKLGRLDCLVITYRQDRCGGANRIRTIPILFPLDDNLTSYYIGRH